MRSKGMKSQFTILLATLLTIGMVLANLVVTTLWQRSLIEAEMEKVRTALFLMADMGEKMAETDQLFSEQSLTRLRQNLEASCVMFTMAGHSSEAPANCGDRHAPLQEKIHQVMETRSASTSVMTSGPEIPFFSRPFFVVAVPLRTRDSQGAIGAVLNLQSVYEQVSQGRHIAHIYILVNVIILTTVGLFRFVKVMVRPIENLVTLTNTYQIDGHSPFALDRGSSEFSRLFGAMNGMLQRIEDDRRKLRDTVNSLERANQQLRDAQQHMVRAEKMVAVGRLAAGLAHEIGNPIGIVQGYVEMLGQSGISQEERHQFAHRCLRELERINRLIRQLLDFSRTRDHESGSTPVHPLLQELVSMLQTRKKPADLTFQLQLEARQDLVAAPDEGLRQVFLNCLLNATDAIAEAIHHRSDSHRGVIRLSSTNINDDEGRPCIQLMIEDNGIGIRETDKPSLFDPFFTTKEPGKGTGLGLFVSYALIEGMGGQIRIEGRENQGATVRILLPLATASQPVNQFTPEQNRTNP